MAGEINSTSIPPKIGGEQVVAPVAPSITILSVAAFAVADEHVNVSGILHSRSEEGVAE